MTINVFFIFPTEPSILTHGNYQRFFKDVDSVKNKIGHADHTLYYDSENLDRFQAQAEGTGIRKEMFNKLLGVRSKNVRVRKPPLHKTECVYAHWDIHSCSTTPHDGILADVSEISTSWERTVLLDVGGDYSGGRNKIHVVKDAIHDATLPVILSTPVVTDGDGFIKWWDDTVEKSVLEKNPNFDKTKEFCKGSAIYKCINNVGDVKKGQFVYRDSLHKNHLEVCDSNRKHLGKTHENAKYKIESGAANPQYSI